MIMQKEPRNKYHDLWNELIKIIWPRYESHSTLNSEKIFQKYYEAIDGLRYTTETTVLRELYNNSLDIYKEEEKRRLNITQKATTSLTATGTLSAIIAGLATLLFSQQLRMNEMYAFLSLIFYAGALIYLLRSILIALKILGRENIRYCIGPDDLPPGNKNERQYILHLSEKYLYYTIENYKLNNIQISKLWVSQESFRNGIIILLMTCTLVIGIRGFAFNDSVKDDSNKITQSKVFRDDQKDLNNDQYFQYPNLYRYLSR